MYYTCILDKSLTTKYSECCFIYLKEQTPRSFICSIFPFMAFHWHVQVGGTIWGCLYPEILCLYSPTHYYFSGAWETGNMRRMWRPKLLELCGLTCTLRVKYVFQSYSVGKASLKARNVCFTNFISYWLNFLLVHLCWN